MLLYLRAIFFFEKNAWLGFPPSKTQSAPPMGGADPPTQSTPNENPSEGGMSKKGGIDPHLPTVNKNLIDWIDIEVESRILNNAKNINVIYVLPADISVPY